MLKDNLKRLRTNRRMSMEEVAKILQITSRRVFSYESGEAEPDLETLMGFADLYDTSVDSLLGHDSADFTEQNGYTLSLAKFGERIRQFRLERNLTAKDISREAGITSQYLLSVENGSKIPKLETAIKILNALGASADYAFMDTLIAAHAARARYLEVQMTILNPKNQRVFLTLAENALKTLKEIEDEK